MASSSAITGSFTATGRSNSFQSQGMKPNWSADITITGTFSASVQLERSLDGGVTWAPMYILGTQYYIYTLPAAETFSDVSTRPIYSINCTAYTSGTVNYWINQ